MKNFFLISVILLLAACKKNDEKNNDAIRASLSTSISAYDQARADHWVKITAAEYKNLSVNVNSSVRAGADDIFMQTSPANGWLADRTVGFSPTEPKVPASSYIIALCVKTGDAPSTSLNSKLKVSDGHTTNYKDYGAQLPESGELAPRTQVYFVLKTPTVLLLTNPHFIAIYNASAYFLGSSNTGSVIYSNGDTSPAIPVQRKSYFQVISTSSKQW